MISSDHQSQPNQGFSSILNGPLLSPNETSRSLHETAYSLETLRDKNPAYKHFLGPRHIRLQSYKVSDYRVGKADSYHAIMVYEFLRLFCQEGPPSQAPDAVVMVDIRGCIHGYGYRGDSLLSNLLSRVYSRPITEMLTERMKQHWLNRNIECIAMQRKHWRLFRFHDSGASYIVLMEFHPVEMQRTALVLWVLPE